MASDRWKSARRKARKDLGKLVGGITTPTRANSEGVAVSQARHSGYDAGSPALAIGAAIRAALDPARAPKPVKSLATMTDEERAEMQRLYGAGPKRK